MNVIPTAPAVAWKNDPCGSASNIVPPACSIAAADNAGTPAAVSNLNDPEFLRLKDFLAERRPAKPVRITRSSGANDSRYFPQFGKPMVGLGGIITHGDHSDDEWIDLDTIDPHVDFICDFITESP